MKINLFFDNIFTTKKTHCHRLLVVIFTTGFRLFYALWCLNFNSFDLEAFQAQNDLENARM